MLVLSRKKDQSIVIDGGIEIQVLQLKGGTVKIGISAPDDVRIVGGELRLFSELMPVDPAPNATSIDESHVSEDRIASVADEGEVTVGGEGKINENRLVYLTQQSSHGVFAK